MLSEFDEMGEGAIIYHIFAPVGCLFLLLLVIRTLRREKKKKKKAARKPAAESTMHEEPRTIEARSDTNMFCHNCGAKLSEGAAFCTACGTKTQTSVPGVCAACGAKLPEGAEFCISCGKAVNRTTPEPSFSVFSTPPQDNTGLVGFSNRINAPEVIEYISKSNKSARGCAFVLIPLPFIIYTIVSFVSDEVQTADALIFGGGISLVFLFFYLLTKYITSPNRSWDGVVIDKKRSEKTKRVRDDFGHDDLIHYTEYVIKFRTDKGKKERCVESNTRGYIDPDYYPYLNIGDRVRYYPQLPYKYEKYDKSRDSEIPCMFCKTFNDIHNYMCASCGKLLFK